MAAKILIVDIENAPNLGMVWKLWDTTVSLDLFLKSNYIMSWAARWLGEDKIYFDSLGQSSKKKMMAGIHKLLNQADIVVHYNGKRHDIPFLNRQFLEEGLAPPAPYKQIDLYSTVKNKFNFPSNKLAYVSKALGIGQKFESDRGYTLWTKCISGDKAAWGRMKLYNMHDVVLTEGLYKKIRAWVSNHPNVALFEKNALACPHCASRHFADRGFVPTKNSLYQQYQCLRPSCKAYFRGTKSLGPVAGKKFSTI